MTDTEKLEAAIAQVEGAIFGARMLLESRSQAATDCLAKTDWRPTRAHVEGMRNCMKDALKELAEARNLLALLRSPQP